MSDRQVEPQRSPSTQTFQSIQALRAVAALLVVVTHAGFAYEAWFETATGATVDVLPWYGLHLFGSSGVHLFFVISGFIIAVQPRPPRLSDYWINRASRIVPLYWLATAYFILTGQPGQSPEWGHSAQSLLFVSPADPVVAVGWTLQWEVLFYLVFGVVMMTLSWRPYWGALLMSVLALVSGLLPFAQPILLEFALGIAVAHLFRHSAIQLLAPAVLAVGVVVLVSTIFWFTPADATGWATFLVWGGPSFLIVLGAVSLEGQRSQPAKKTLLSALGDASYATYLAHWCLLFGNWNLASLMFARSDIVRSWDPTVAILVFAATTHAIAYAVHRLVERPINHVFKYALSALRTNMLRIGHGG